MLDDDDYDNVGVGVDFDDGSVCSPRQAIYRWLSVALAALAELLTSLMLLAAACIVVVVVIVRPLLMVALRRRLLVDDGDVDARRR